MNHNIRIIGPTVNGTFFIANTDNHVWDGKCWRGFGQPAEWRTFKEAFIATKKASAAMDKKKRSH